MSPAVTPLVRKTKTDFPKATVNDDENPVRPAENITATFEMPSLAPGGKNGIGGINDSKNESIMASAVITPLKAIFFDFVLNVDINM